MRIVRALPVRAKLERPTSESKSATRPCMTPDWSVTVVLRCHFADETWDGSNRLAAHASLGKSRPSQRLLS